MGEPLRVLCVFSTLDRGGAESMCMNLYRHIDRERVQFDFVKHTPSKGAFEDEIRSLGGRIFEAPRYKFYNHVKYIRWWQNHFKVHPEHTIVHGHFYTISAIYFKVAKRFGRTTVAHSHCVSTGKRTIRGIIGDLLIGKIDKYSDERFACSFPAGEWIFKKHHFTVLKNAIESELFRYNTKVRENVRTELGIDSDCLVVGTVGRIMHQKNPNGIIEIFQRVLGKNKKARLLWVGDGPDKASVEEQLSERKITDKVIMTGVRRDVNRLMQAMDVFILPSYFEGLPVVIVEAQAAGLKCFVSETVTREADITGRCTYLNVTDYVRWAEEICSADLTKVDTYDQICEAGYDVQKSAEWLQEFYLKISK